MANLQQHEPFGMTHAQIISLQASLSERSDLIETHISWVLLGPTRVYKIRKPIRYAFLDFSTLERRKEDCEKELALNRRTSPEIYLRVVPILAEDGDIHLGEGSGELIDHAVEMVRLESHRQMNVLLRDGTVTSRDMKRLAGHLAWFHQQAERVEVAPSAHGLWLDFADVLKVESLTRNTLGEEAAAQLRHCVSTVKQLLDSLESRILERHALGFTRDVHGDLHTRNIFLLPEPVLFDCLEFNDHLRQIDLLNEIAFLGMDLESVGRTDLWTFFLAEYQQKLPLILDANDKVLLKFYLGYRANVRYKVAALRVIQDQSSLDINTLEHSFQHMLQYFKDDASFKYIIK